MSSSSSTCNAHTRPIAFAGPFTHTDKSGAALTTGFHAPLAGSYSSSSPASSSKRQVADCVSKCTRGSEAKAAAWEAAEEPAAACGGGALVVVEDMFGLVAHTTPALSPFGRWARSSTQQCFHTRLIDQDHACSLSIYFTSNMGKYAFGSCGASAAISGTHFLNAMGSAGGSFDSEYALRADEMVAMASVRSMEGADGAGTDESVTAAWPCSDGAATLHQRRQR